MIVRGEDGSKRRIRNRRYVDRRYLKLKQKLSYKEWFEMVKYNVANGKVYHAQSTSAAEEKDSIGEL